MALLKLRNIALVLEYDGASFSGFQRQPGRRTVQSALEEALCRLLSQKVKIAAASGRTDSGAHAEAQVVNFRTNSELDPEKMRRGLNALLPKEAAVKEVSEVPPEFHARYSVKTKIYEYCIWNDKARSPLRAARTCHVPYRLNLARMRRAARALEGKHDFRSFCAADPSARGDKNTVRTLLSFRIKKEGSLLRFRLEGDGFLYRMVRNLAGTVVEVGAGRLAPEDMRVILKAKDRRRAGKALPAKGLTLIRVDY